MAPTTLLGQKTTTSPRGRDMARHEGGPIRMAELMAQLSGVAYSERCALDSVKHVRAAKKALRKAFEVQLQGLGFITMMIRKFGTMNEGVSFAILLMNLLVPYIDVLTRQDKLGIAKAKKEKEAAAK